MLPAVFATLKTSADVCNLVGPSANALRIWRHTAPDDYPRPIRQAYVTWFVVTSVPENNLSDPPPLDRVVIQVDCWHPDDRGAVALATAVRDCIEPHAHMTAMPIDQKDTETQLYRIALQFDWFDGR